MNWLRRLFSKKEPAQIPEPAPTAEQLAIIQAVTATLRGKQRYWIAAMSTPTIELYDPNYRRQLLGTDLKDIENRNFKFPACAHSQVVTEFHIRDDADRFIGKIALSYPVMVSAGSYFVANLTHVIFQ